MLTIGAETVNLILRDEATLRVNGTIGASGFPDGVTLNVYMQKDGTGKLEAPYGVSPVGSELTISPIGTPMKKVETDNDGFTLSKCEHEGIVYSTSDATKHEGTCDYCGTTVSGKHSYGAWEQNNADSHKAVCTVCNFEKTAEHDFKLIPLADGQHHVWLCRTCHYEDPVVPIHFYDENGICSCGAVLTATCGGVEYAALDKAIETARTLSESGGSAVSVTLARNVMNEVQATISSGKVVIDLGGYTWKNSATPLTVSGGEVTLQNGVLSQSGMTAIGEGNGLVITGGSVTVGENTVIDGVDRSIEVQEGGTLTLEAGATLTNALKVPNTMKLADCLASGTAFVKCTVNGTTVTPSNPAEYITEAYSVSESTKDAEGAAAPMTVVAHRHSIVNGKPCDCGYACSNDHSAGWDASACPVCGMAASVEVTGADGTAKYFAAFADAITYANGQKNCTVTLLQDVEAEDPYATDLAYVTGPFTLDLNGYVMHEDVTVGEEVYKVDENGEYIRDEDDQLILEKTIPGYLTVVDSSTAKTGTVGNLTLYAGTLDISGAFVERLECESGGTVTASGNIDGDGDDGIDWSIYGALTINDDVTVGDANLRNYDGSIIIEGGTFGVTDFFNYDGSFAISGGTFAEVVSIGKNNDDKTPLMNLLAKGYAFWSVGKNEVVDASGTTLEETVEVRAHKHHIESNGKCACGVKTVVIDSKGDIYGTLQSALNTAIKDSTIEWVQLGQDVTEEVTFNGGEANVTLDMNGKTLTTDAGSPLTVTGGTLTIKGEATIIQATSTAADPRPAVHLTGGTLVFEGVLTTEGGTKQATHTRQPGVLAEGGVLEFKSAVHLLGGLTMKGDAELRGGLKLGSTLAYTEGSQEIRTNTIDVRESKRYKNLRELLESDDTLAYRCDSDAAGPSLMSVADTYKWGMGIYTVVAHTHTYTAGGSNDADWADCACGKTCWHEYGNSWKNGVCTLCGVTCLHRDEKVNTETYTCGICKADLAASVSDDETFTYYVGLADALNAAGAKTSGIVNVTLLRNAYMWLITTDKKGHEGEPVFPTTTGVNITGGAEVWLNLNGYTVTGGNSSDTPTTLNVKAGTLKVTDEKGAGALNRTVINVSGGTVTVNSTVGKVERLNVSGGTVTLSGGTYGRIDAPNGAKAGELLFKGYAFKTEGGQFVNYTASANAMTNVSVVTCEHGSAVDMTTGVCAYCGKKFVARFVYNSSGLVQYWDELYSSFMNGSLTLLDDCRADITTGGTCVIDMNGHALTSRTTIAGIATITGKGSLSYVYLNGTMSIANDDVTVDGLNVQANGGTKLEHGTFGKIYTQYSSTEMTVGELLAEGYAFYGKDGNGEYTVLKRMDETTLENVKVLKHTHQYTDGVCACGDECDVLLNGTQKFSSIQAAVDAILASETREGTILLAKDRAENVTVDGPNAKITIDLGGNTWTAYLADGEASPALFVTGKSGGYGHSFNNESVVTVQNGTIKQGGTGDTAASAIKTESYSTLALGKDITVVKGDGTQCYAVDMSSSSSDKALLLWAGSALIGGVKGDYFSHSETPLPNWLAEGAAFVRCTYDESTGTVTATDPGQYASDLYNRYQSGDDLMVVAHSHTLTAGKCECGYTCPHAGMSEETGYYCDECKQTFVAKTVTQVTASTSTTRYATTLEDALTATNGVPEVTLLTDVDLGAKTLVVKDKMRASVLDLNGHTLFGSGDVVLEIWCSSGLTIRNGTIENTGSGDVILLSRGSGTSGIEDGNLTLDGKVMVTAKEGWAVRVAYTPNAATGTDPNPERAQLTIKDGTLQGGLNIGGANVYLGKVQISGGTFIANPGTHSVYYPGSHSSVTGLVGQLKKVLAEGLTYGDAKGNAIKYFDETNRTIVDTSNPKWPKGVYLNDTTVTIVEHKTHDIDRTSKTCTICGAPCPHAAWNDDGICTACGDRVMYCKTDDGTLYPTVQEAQSAVQDRTNNPTITLLENCWDMTLAGTANGCTLDLNGFHAGGSQTRIIKDHVLTIIDSSEGKTGSVGGIWADGGHVTIQDGSYAKIMASYENSIKITGEGTVKIRNIQMLGPTDGSNKKVVADLLYPGYAVYLVDENTTPATYTVVNGYYNANNTNSGYLQQYLPGDYKDSLTELSEGQYYTVAKHDHGFTVSTVNPCPTGCGFTCDHSNVGADGTCDGCGTVFTAKVTNADESQTVYYVDLTTALNSAVDGDTVMLLGDGPLTTDAYLYNESAATAEDMKVTLDLNGHNVTKSGWASVTLGKGAYDWTKPNDTPEGPYKLIIRGSGNFEPQIAVDVKAALDLNGWTGGTMEYVSTRMNGNTGETATLTIGEKAGRIKLLGFGNWQAETIANTSLRGGSYDQILMETFIEKPTQMGGALAAGYAFQNADGTFVPYATAFEISGTLNNVKVVLCPHEVIENGRCVYCNEAYAAKVNRTAYKTYGEAETAWLTSGGTLTLYQNVDNMASANWTGVSGKTYTLDLNGYKIADGNMYNEDSGQYAPSWRITVSDMALTIKDGSEAGNGQVDNLVMSAKGKLTLESGWLGHLTVPKDETVQVTLQGGGLKSRYETAIPVAYLLADGYDLKEVPDLSDDGEGNLSTYTVEKAPAAFGGGKSGTMPNGRNKLPFAPTVTVDEGEEVPASISVAWYLEDGTSLASAKLVKSETGWVYDSSKESAGYQAYDKLAIGGTYDVFAVVQAYDESGAALWRAALNGYELTIGKGDLADAVVELVNKDAMVFLPQSADSKNGTELTQQVSVVLYGKTLDAEDYVVSGNTGTNAGDYKLTVAAAEGSALYTGSTEADWSIAPFPLRDANVSLVKRYDGTAAVNMDTATVDGFEPVDCSYFIYFRGLEKGTDYELSGISENYPSAEQGKYTDMKATVTLKNSNYVFANGTMAYEWVKTIADDYCKIDYADAPANVNTTLTVMNDHAGTYTLDVSQLLPALAAGCSYGEPTRYLIEMSGKSFVKLDEQYYDEGAASIGENGLLTLPIKAVQSSTEESIGTVTAKVVSQNYYTFDVVVDVETVNKLVPTGAPTLDKTTITYGETVGSIGLSGSMTAGGETVKGTFAWDAPETKPGAQSGYQAAWTFTPEDAQHYQTVQGKARITVEQAELTGVSVKQTGTLTYNGSAQAAQVETKAATVDGSSVKFRYSAVKNGSYTAKMPEFTNAGTYTVYYEAFD